MKSLIRDAIRRMNGYVPGEQPADGMAVIKLNTNESPYPPAPAVVAALATFDPADLRLYPDPSAVALRSRFARLHGFALENVFAGNGSDEILALCARCFLDPGGVVGYLDPSYSVYPVCAQAADARHEPVPLRPDFSWELPARLASDLFFLANPHAPSGVRYDIGLVERLCDAVEGVVVADEAYVDFADGNCLELARRRDNLLIVRTLSKSYALAGLRVGFALGPAPLIAALDKVKDSYNLDRLSQRLALAAIEDQAYLSRTVEAIRQTRARVTRALVALGFGVHPSQTNFLLARAPKGIPARRLFETLKARGLWVRYFDAPLTRDCLRITIGTDEQMDRLIAETKRLIEENTP